jgi:hypothetical protein
MLYCSRRSTFLGVLTAELREAVSVKKELKSLFLFKKALGCFVIFCIFYIGVFSQFYPFSESKTVSPTPVIFAKAHRRTTITVEHREHSQSFFTRSLNVGARISRER